MTAQTTTVRQSKAGFRVLIATTAATLVLTGSAALWQARPESRDTAAGMSVLTHSSTGEGTTARGGLAELHLDQQQAAATMAEGSAPTIGGMAELYAGQQSASPATTTRIDTRGGMAERYAEPAALAPARPAAAVDTRGGMAELYAERQVRALADAEQGARIGGMAELYRDLARAQAGGR